MTRKPYPTGAILAIQAGVALLSWGGIGFVSGRWSWLFGVAQAHLALQFFRWQFPVLGAAGAILLPGFLYDRLRLAEEEEPGILDSAFVEKVLAFPRRAAILSFATSVLLFLLGAVELRVFAASPPEESLKIALMGPVTGLIFGTLSYLFLFPLMRPLLAAAVARGALPVPRTVFPIGEKVFLCSLAIAIVTVGLYAPISLTWSQRDIEQEAAAQAENALARIVPAISTVRPRTPEQWRAFLSRQLGPVDELVVTDASGRPLADVALRGRESSFFKNPENLDFLRIRQAGSFTSRRDRNLVVSNASLPMGGKIYSAVVPDREAEKKLFIEIVRMAVLVLVLAAFVSWAAGRAVAQPIRALEQASRRFAEDPGAGEILPEPSDDETGQLSSAFSDLSRSVGQMRARLARTERLAGAAESMAAMAHEIRNPLFGITSTAAALQGDAAGDVRIEEHVRVITRESARMSRLVDEMLTARGSPVLERRSYSVAALLEEAVAWARNRSPEGEIRLSFPGSAELPPVECDGEKIGRVLANLLENALLSQSGPPKVLLAARAEGANLRMDIDDAGPGVPPPLRERIFDPFYSDRRGGTGLGLFVSRSVVLAHGGSIEVGDGSLGGARFTVRIPFHPEGQRGDLSV